MSLLQLPALLSAWFTKLELAAELARWLHIWLSSLGKELWLVVAGQQQVWNVYAIIGAFTVNLVLYSVVEA